MTAYLTQRDVNEFGYELLDVAQRAAQHAMAPELQRLHNENLALQNQLDATTKATIDRELDSAVPNWRSINADERFHSWLLQPDTYSGVIRDRLLKDAAAEGNAQRVATFFRGFLAAAGQASAGQAPASSVPQRTSRRAPSGQRIYDRSEITQMWNLRRQGKIDDQAWLRWEHELIAAGRDGRIVGALDIDGIPKSR